MKWLAALTPVLALLAACSTSSQITPDKLRTQLQTALPIGSSFKAVADYLNANSLNDGIVISDKDLYPVIGKPELLELKSIARNTRKSLMVKTSISMTFLFDQSRKLTAMDVKEVYTGP